MRADKMWGIKIMCLDLKKVSIMDAVLGAFMFIAVGLVGIASLLLIYIVVSTQSLNIFLFLVPVPIWLLFPLMILLLVFFTKYKGGLK